MPTHSHARTNKHRAHKTLKVSHKHNKAYRKSHILLLLLSLLGILGLSFYILRYNLLAQNETKNAQNYVSDNTTTNNPQPQIVNSTYGFSFRYDPAKFYGSAIDSTSGGLFIGSELGNTRAYEVVKLSASSVSQSKNASTISLTYHNNIVANANNADYTALEKQLVQDVKVSEGANYTRKASTDVTLDGVKFVRTVWTQQLDPKLVPQLKTSFVSYTGIVNGRPLTIEVTTKLGSDVVDNDVQAVIDSISFGSAIQAYRPASPAVAARKARSLSLLDKVTFTASAAAASNENSNVTAAEKVSSLYGPATVKVYNVYCMDISVLGRPYLKNACNGLTGSAFFVSNDGYLATNGHVGTSDPKDIVIQNAIAYAQHGQNQYLYDLIQLAKVNVNDPAYASLTEAQFVGKLIDKFYQIPDSTFTKTNDVSNLLVALNETQPNIEELITDTKARKVYPEQSSIKHAKVVAANYRAFDGIDGFKASDVAIMKIDGNDFPLVKLGAIDNVSQGSDLNIIGYPGNASDNGLVDDTHSKATLTTGKVSSIKNASGSDKKLIETDTTIGHGNSGGPVFDDNGDVVGIATYTIDGSGSGNGVYNYVRDIKDLIDLAGTKSISFNTASDVQKNWESGIDYFYISHYSKALGYFEKVKQLYPQHPTVDSFVSTAKTRIANGQDIKDFPVVPVAIVSIVLIAGAGTAVFLIVRHKKTHNIYRHQVAQNNMMPVTPVNSPATTSYDPSQYGRMGQPAIAPTQATGAQPAPVQPQQTTQVPVAQTGTPTVVTPSSAPTQIVVGGGSGPNQTTPPQVQG